MADAFRVALGADEFAELVSGRVAKTVARIGNVTCTVEIILSDIGFAKMLEVIADAVAQRK